jgi:hypothetical protein
VEKLGADLLLAQAAQHRGLGRGEGEPAGQSRQRPAAVRLLCLAQIMLDQAQLGIARRLEGERVQQLGEGLHQVAISAHHDLALRSERSERLEG